LGLTLEEFEDLTPAGFRALCKRRNIRFKMDRYAAAISASAIYNVNRANTDTPLIEPMDFVREPDPYRENTLEIKRLIKQVIGQLPAGTAAEKLQVVRTRTIASLLSQGRQDAEALFNECWPNLKR
jgi:hypothetical protein